MSRGLLGAGAGAAGATLYLKPEIVQDYVKELVFGPRPSAGALTDGVGKELEHLQRLVSHALSPPLAGATGGAYRVRLPRSPTTFVRRAALNPCCAAAHRRAPSAAHHGTAEAWVAARCRRWPSLAACWRHKRTVCPLVPPPPQVEDLSRQVAATSKQPGVTVVHTGADRGGSYILYGSAAAGLGVVLYFRVLRGWTFGDMLYATRRGLRDGLNQVSAGPWVARQGAAGRRRERERERGRVPGQGPRARPDQQACWLGRRGCLPACLLAGQARRKPRAPPAWTASPSCRCRCRAPPPLCRRA